MRSSILGFIVWISLLLPNNHSVRANANLTNTTLYSTHPQFAYAPESCCMKGRFGKCKRYDPFTMTTYVGPDSTKRTFFQTSSWGNEPNSSNMKRRVEISFYGQAVYVYGPPRAQLDNRPGHIQIFLNGLVMTSIDLEAKYGETDDNLWSPRLIYHWQGGGIDASHILQISLLDSGSRPIQGFGIDSVVYTSLEPRRPPRYELSESEELEEVTIQDTNFVTTFTPAHAWEKHISAFVSSQGDRTFHGTSNRLADTSRDTAAIPVAEFTAQCAAMAIYGASPTQLEATFARGFRHGHLEICIGITCEYIDAHQAYLHVPEQLRNEPVLIYSSDQMLPSSLQAVKMRFLDPPSPVGHLWTMTFSHAVCSQVVPKWPWTHPIPNGRYSTHIIPFDKLGYTPSFLSGAFSPWSRMDRYSFAPAEPYWFSGMFREMPGWSTAVQGHDIKIFVPPPAQFPKFQYANVRCCIDGRCHYPDIEQWSLKARDSQSNIPLVHYQNLNPFRGHLISMTAVRREDEVGDKVIAVSQVEYQQVVVVHQPSKPVEGLPLPTTKPIDDHNGTLAFGLAALAVAVLMSFWWCFALILMDAQRRGPERDPLLPAPGSRPRPQPQPQSFIWRPSFSSEIDRMSEESSADSLTRPLGAARGSQFGPRFTSSDYGDERSNFSSEIDRLRSKFAVNAPTGSPPNPPGSHTGAPGPSGGWRSTNPGSSSTSRDRYDERPTSPIAAWIENTTPHHHGQLPSSPNGTDRGYGDFIPSGYQSQNGQPLPDGAHSRYQQLAYNANPWPPGSSSRSTCDALSPAIRGLRPFSPTFTDPNIPPPYLDRIAPPSYDACVTTGAVVGTPPRPHAPITVPAPPPPRRAEPAARLNPIPERTDGNSGYQGTAGRVQDNQRPGPLRQATEGSAGRGMGRPGHRQQSLAETAVGPSLTAAEETTSDRGRGRGRRRRRGSGRRRSRGGGGRGGTSGS